MKRKIRIIACFTPNGIRFRADWESISNKVYVKRLANVGGSWVEVWMHPRDAEIYHERQMLNSLLEGA